MNAFEKSSRSARITFLNGNRLYLRPLCESDTSLFVQWFNDPEVTRFFPARHPMTWEDEARWVQGLDNEDDQIVLTIVLKEKDRPIGALGIHSIDHVSHVAMTGITIGEKDCWSKGYAVEAELLLLGYAFDTLNLRKIYAHVLSTNRRSDHLFRRSGYDLEATLHKRHFCRGRYVDELVFSIEGVKWRKIFAKFSSKET
ncbi:GNAT family N-acetyltransferase [Patescibacteria group bacterium]|nr:GNAT family N-acetyltransferase [Patescibacteria group bacterium]